MSQFPWEGDVLFQGTLTPAQDPMELYFRLDGNDDSRFLFGSRSDGYASFFEKRQWSVAHVWMLLSTVVPIILILVLGSVMYDGWRHLYFTDPGFCGLRFSVFVL